jgi:hypothetical protein
LVFYAKKKLFALVLLVEIFAKFTVFYLKNLNGILLAKLNIFLPAKFE